MPHRATTHDHVSRWSTDGSYKSPHMIRAIEYHTFPRQPLQCRSLQLRAWVVHLKILWRLVID